MAAFTARYASALADVLFERGLDPETAQRQLGDFAAAWRESRDLREVFLDPSFPAERKVSILDKLNERLGMMVEVRNFLAVLINHERMDSFEAILTDFRREMNARLNIAEVEVMSARKLDEGERRRLEERAAEMTGSTISAQFHEDPSLIGGVILKIGSTVYDDSVRGRLRRLKELLAAS